MGAVMHDQLAAPARPRHRGSGRTRQTTLVRCERCEELLGHWQNARLVTRQVFTVIRRTGRVTLSCARCSNRTEVTVRQQPRIYLGGDDDSP